MVRRRTAHGRFARVAGRARACGGSAAVSAVSAVAAVAAVAAAADRLEELAVVGLAQPRGERREARRHLGALGRHAERRSELLDALLLRRQPLHRPEVRDASRREREMLRLELRALGDDDEVVGRGLAALVAPPIQVHKLGVAVLRDAREEVSGVAAAVAVLRAVVRINRRVRLAVVVVGLAVADGSGAAALRPWRRAARQAAAAGPRAAARLERRRRFASHVERMQLRRLPVVLARTRRARAGLVADRPRARGRGSRRTRPRGRRPRLERHKGAPLSRLGRRFRRARPCRWSAAWLRHCSARRARRGQRTSGSRVARARRGRSSGRRWPRPRRGWSLFGREQRERSRLELGPGGSVELHRELGEAGVLHGERGDGERPSGQGRRDRSERANALPADAS